MKYDYLIIGQGLAGTVMAYQLLERGKRIVIIDEKLKNTSSRVAAGLVNPFTGPKMVKTWRAEILFPYLVEFYKKLEKKTKASFFSERKLYRPFASAEDLNDWYGRSSLPNYQPFIHKLCDSNTHQKYIYDPFGGIEINAFVLNVPLFLDAMEEYFSQQCDLLEERFEEADLKINSDNVTYRGIKANKVIFCNGYQVKNSMYFGWIPIAPLKGEILHAEFEQDFQTIYNRSCFIIPAQQNKCKVGSTYDRHDMSNSITDSGRDEICEKLEALSPMKYKIVGQQAGIRPASVSRRPLIGVHPEYDRLFVFNGMGTKGVSLAPFFSNQMANCLEEGNNLDAEVDIKKYYSLYSDSQFHIES